MLFQSFVRVTRLVRNVLPERVQHLMWIMELEEGRDVFE